MGDFRPTPEELALYEAAKARVRAESWPKHLEQLDARHRKRLNRWGALSHDSFMPLVYHYRGPQPRELWERDDQVLFASGVNWRDWWSG